MTEIMTLREFKKAIDDWGNNWGIEAEVVIEKDWTYIYATRKDEDLGVIAVISNGKVCTLNFSRLETIHLDGAERQTLFRIVTKFANTWPADRKGKGKKFYLRHKFIKSLCKQTYLIGDLNYFWLSIDDKSVDEGMQFTLEEIEKIKNKFDTDLKDFEPIEVEEDA